MGPVDDGEDGCLSFYKKVRSGIRLRRRLFENSFDLLLQMRQIFFCSIPDFVKIDTKVLVDQEMTHSDDILPGNRCM